MNPVGGGRLAEKSRVLEKLAGEVGAVSVPDMAIRYVLSNSNVTTIMSGLTKLSDVSDTVASAERPLLTPAQTATIDSSLEKIRGEVKSFCTACRYCMPCPAGIDIPEVMACIQDFKHWGWEESARARYKRMGSKKADACTKCGKCEKACTQHLKVIEHMLFSQQTFKD